MQNDNPLFPGAAPPDQPAEAGYLLPKQRPKVQPLGGDGSTGVNAAVNLIREKLARIYAEEPDPLAEEKKAEAARPRSKHQQFIHELSTSGKNLVEIQTAWHNYYVTLPDEEKHQVWQEFYEANNVAHELRHTTAAAAASTPPHQPAVLSQNYRPRMPRGSVFVSQAAEVETDKRTPTAIRRTIQDKVTAGGRLKIKHHLQSLTFGLGLGFITLVIFLFGFFNEVIIAPFIQPSRNVGATPIIVDPSTVTASSVPEIIIPKINLEIPADFSQTSTNEASIENALENGIVHYPSTVMPGQTGNAAFFGHSSNNIFNPGKYKFAFVLLHELVPGDTFYITYNSKVYIYKVFDRQIVDPSAIQVLNNVEGHTATATLITCDPPGTSLHRLVVVGDQISPDPSSNAVGDNTTDTTVSPSTQLPDNGPSLLQRIWNSIF